MREALTTVQLGDAVKGEDSCSMQAVEYVPCDAGRKLSPVTEMTLPGYVSEPGNADVGYSDLTTGADEIIRDDINFNLLGLPKCMTMEFVPVGANEDMVTIPTTTFIEGDSTKLHVPTTAWSMRASQG